MTDEDARQVTSWSEQLAKEDSVTLGLSRPSRLKYGLGGALIVVLGVIFFAREGSGLFRVLSGLATAWGAVLLCIPTLPPLRRRFEIVVDGVGIHTTSILVPWADLGDVILGSVSGRQAVLLEAKTGTLSGQSPMLAPGQGIYLPYTLPSSPTALATWLADEGHARGQSRGRSAPPQ